MNSVIGALFIYAVVLVMTRLSGRRTLAQVTVFDLVLVLLAFGLRASSCARLRFSRSLTSGASRIARAPAW